jgi:hypothetical protein
LTIFLLLILLFRQLLKKLLAKVANFHQFDKLANKKYIKIVKNDVIPEIILVFCQNLSFLKLFFILNLELALFITLFF